MILEALYFQSVYFDSCFLRKFPEICTTEFFFKNDKS